MKVCCIPILYYTRIPLTLFALSELNSQKGRNVFYHYASSISDFVDFKNTTIFSSDSQIDNEGFSKGSIGQHLIPFDVLISVNQGARGSCELKQGSIRYLVIA